MGDQRPETKPERLIMAKELVEHFSAQGVHIHYAYARALIVACPDSIRGRYVRASDAWTFWVLNPGFRPYGKAPADRSLAESMQNSPSLVSARERS